MASLQVQGSKLHSFASVIPASTPRLSEGFERRLLKREVLSPDHRLSILDRFRLLDNSPPAMWKTSVTRELMLQKISLIAMLEPLRIGAKENHLTSYDDSRRYLTVAQEAEIVRNLSFLCYRRKDPQAVSAICVEEVSAGKGLVVRLAVNGTVILYAEEGLRQICALLEQFSRHAKLIVIFLTHAVLIYCFDDQNAGQSDANMLFERVVKLDISRICARLQLRRKQDVKSSLVMQLYGAVNRLRTDIPDEFREIQSQVRELVDTYPSLKQRYKHPLEALTYRQLEKMIKIARRVDQSPSLSTLLSHDSTLSPERVIIMKDWVAKLGHYYNACDALVSPATRK